MCTVDWEHPSSPEEGKRYLHLLTRLRASLPSSRYLLTTAIPAGNWVLRNLRLAQVAEQVDLINLMAYDFVGATFTNIKLSGHHAQLRTPTSSSNDVAKLSGESAVSYLLSQGVPANKLLLGIPLYGRSFLGAKDIDQPFHGAGGREGVFEVRDLPLLGTKEMYDESLGAAFCVGAEGGFVSYDNLASTGAKADFVRQKGLAGLFFWHMGCDRCNEDSLVAAGYRALGLEDSSKVQEGVPTESNELRN